MAYDKVVDSTFLDGGLTLIADAIREKNGSEDELLFPDDFVTAIAAIEGGGSGATLVVNSFGTGIVTVSNAELDKSYSKAVTMGGSVEFKGLATGTWTVTLSNGSQTSTQTVNITADYSVAVAFFAATINITYPEGSTCTATDGVSTFTAPDTSGTWALVVPKAGTWTISATDGTDTTSQTVEISAEGQSLDVELSYKLYLFKSGEGAKVELSTSKEDSQCYATVGADKISLGWQSNNRTTAFSTADKKDLTGFSTLEIEYTCSDAGSGSYYEAFGVSANKVSTGTTAANLTVSRKALTVTSAKKTDTLDISGVDGFYYVGVCGAGKAEIYNMLLLP